MASGQNSGKTAKKRSKYKLELFRFHQKHHKDGASENGKTPR